MVTSSSSGSKKGSAYTDDDNNHNNKSKDFGEEAEQKQELCASEVRWFQVGTPTM